MIEHHAIVKRLPHPAPTRVLVYRCVGCGKWRPWCDGGTDSHLCDACWANGKGHHGCSECAPFTAEMNGRLGQ